jgi:hypothetical protein
MKVARQVPFRLAGDRVYRGNQAGVAIRELGQISPSWKSAPTQCRPWPAMPSGQMSALVLMYVSKYRHSKP